MLDLPPPFDSIIFRAIIGAIIGASLGSFGTMLAYRVPRRLSIVTPRSHCPSCNITLTTRDLFPLLSWLFLRGECRHCHAKIGNQYLWIEVACTLICAFIAVAIGLQ